MMPRMKFNRWLQFTFNLCVDQCQIYEELVRIKQKIVIVFDSSDEIIGFNCSDYIGVSYLLNDLFEFLEAKTKDKIKKSEHEKPLLKTPKKTPNDKNKKHEYSEIKNKQTNCSKNQTLETNQEEKQMDVKIDEEFIEYAKKKHHNSINNLLTKSICSISNTTNDIKNPDVLFSKVSHLMSLDKFNRLYSKLCSIFDFVRSVDLNSRIDESQTINRVSVTSINIKGMSSEVTSVLNVMNTKKTKIEYNDKDGKMIKAFNEEETGLSEIVIKFVKFMHRIEVCSLSLFDVFCPKLLDERILKTLLWNLSFMFKVSKMNDNLDMKDKLDEKAIKYGIIKSYR